MVDGGSNIVEANWVSVSSILQVVRAHFPYSLCLQSKSLLQLETFGPSAPVMLEAR